MKVSPLKDKLGISVVIPTYNRFDLLIEAVQSVITARPNQVEIIIVDDASIENPCSLLPPRNKSNVSIRCYRLNQNSGPQSARNLGIRRAEFSYIAFLDSDDFFNPLKIDTLLDIISTRSYDVIFHEVDGMEKYNWLAGIWDRRFQHIIPFHWLLMFYNPIATPALTFRRRIKLGPVGWRHCEDYAFLLNYCDSASKVLFISKKLSGVRRNIGTTGGLSSALWSMRKGEFRARQLLLRKEPIGNFGRFLIGSCVGTLRLVKDIICMRYWKS
jgi:glycosyltransferase involved in cell wall biosynthesis